MKRFSIYQSLFITRRLLLIGVLAALIFSSGEGISFLPFSQPSGDKPISADFLNSGLNSYVFSVHGSNIRSIKSFVHFKRNVKLHSISASLFSQQFEELRNSSIVSTGEFFGASKFYPLNSVLSQPSGRAPPTI